MKLQSLAFYSVFSAAISGAASGAEIPYPILFVTQVPPSVMQNSVTSISGNLLSTTEAAPRGGDLVIVYPDRTTKSLTRLAGYGLEGEHQKGPNAISVRDPHVHFSGTKALFSMVAGAPATPWDSTGFFWQIYEVTGLGQNETPVITKVANQAADYNNVQPAYLPDGRIVFSSDRPITGQPHLYPALDEDGLGPAGTGLWVINPAAPASQPVLLTHATSGASKPFVDSYGRVMFTRWDVLQRDKLVSNGTAQDFQSEAPGSAYGQYAEVFPEALTDQGTAFGHHFDLFMPWTINQDGTELNTLNHLGRHELCLNFPRSGQGNGLQDFVSGDFGTPGLPPVVTRAGSFFQLSEHPFSAGRYVATDVIMTSVSAGRVVSVLAPPGRNPDDVKVTLISTSGIARDVSWLSNGVLMGSWSSGFASSPNSSYGALPVNLPPSIVSLEFTVRIGTENIRLENSNPLTGLTTRTVVQYINGAEVRRTGPLWQLQPVEVRPRTVPRATTQTLEDPEASVFIRNGVSPSGFKTWLTGQNKALLVARNVTTRDGGDRQQPFSLNVAGGVSSLVEGVSPKTVERVQFFQGEYLRAYSPSGGGAPNAGRRVTARPMSAAAFASNPPAGGAEGSVPVALDGSMAAIVPAGRATTWQLTDHDANPVVRERYWLNFTAGEVRACTSCHGANSVDQTGKPPATNAPEALNSLLAYWKTANPGAPAQTTSYKVWSEVKLQDPADTTMHADDDGDGLTNLEEFVYGSDPRTSSEAPFAARHDSEGTVTLNFSRNRDAAGTGILAESSPDLTNWREAARINDGAATGAPGVTVTETPPSLGSAHRVSTVSITIPSQIRQYFRLKFTIP